MLCSAACRHFLSRAEPHEAESEGERATAAASRRGQLGAPGGAEPGHQPAPLPARRHPGVLHYLIGLPCVENFSAGNLGTESID